jgi:Spy/CpxP family protein refolding chaperone
MKNKTLLRVLAAALAAAGLLVTETHAAGDQTAAPAHGGWLQRVADKLNLTAGQRSQIKTILTGEKTTLSPLIGALHQARQNLRAAIRAGDATEESVRAASAQVAAAEANLAVERMKLLPADLAHPHRRPAPATRRPGAARRRVCGSGPRAPGRRLEPVTLQAPPGHGTLDKLNA